MKLTVNYGKSVVCIPGNTIEHLDKISETELRVLLSVCADSSMTDKARAKLLGITETDVKSAVSFWRGKDIISFAEKECSASAKDKFDEQSTINGKNRKPSNSGIPKYTTEELTAAIKKDSRKELLEYCQQSFGRVFNQSEAELVVGICDYMNVSTDYVALLCDKLAKEKKGLLSIRSLENTAQKLYDRGICDTASLISYFEIREKATTLSGKIRSLFGIGGRQFTPTEEKMIEKWANADFEEGMLEYAYELTVNATGEAPLKYTDKIVDSWIAEGFKTLNEAKSKQIEFEKKKKPVKRKQQADISSESSFTTDDFFESDLMRSYEGMDKSENK